MKDSLFVGTFLFLALLVVSCDCRRVKRQDLIPFPRVGKRAWNRDDDITRKGSVASLVEKVLEQSPIQAGTADQNNWILANTYPQDSKLKGLDTTGDMQALLKSLLSGTGDSNSRQSSGRASDIHDHKVFRKVARRGPRPPVQSLESSGISSLLVHQLLDRLREKTPEDLAGLLQGKLSDQDAVTE